MLQEISITNFAIIPELRLSFHEGMTALTGETGCITFKLRSECDATRNQYY